MLFRKTVSVLLLILLFGAILFAYLVLPNILASVLKNTFQKGTGCEVSLSHPKVDYLNVRASISDVSVICPDENEGEGFYASKIIAGLDLKELLNKKALVTPLRIYGASVKSLDWDSAFIRTLKFVLSKPENRKRGWSGWVPYITIKTVRDEKKQFVFGNEDFYISADKVIFTSIDAVDRPETAVIMEARAFGVEVVPQGHPPVFLGELDLIAEAKQGKILFSDTEIQHQTANSTGQSRLSGYIEIEDKEMFLELETKVDSESLETLSNSEFKSNLRGKFDLRTSVRGKFDNPSFIFELTADELNFPLSEADVPNCQPLKGFSRIEFANNVLMIPEFKIENLVELNDVNFRLGDSYKISHDNLFSIDLNSLSSFFCFKREPGNLKSFGSEQLQGSIALTIGDDQKLNGSLELREFNLSKIPFVDGLFKKGKHSANFHGKISGEVLSPELEGKVEVKSIFEKKVDNSSLTLRMDREKILLEGNLFKKENKLDLKYSAFSKGETRVLLEFKNFPLFYFSDNEKNSNFTINGELDLVSPDSDIKKLTGDVTVYSLDLRPAYKEFTPKDPVRLVLKDGNFIIRELTFEYEGLAVRVFGEVENLNNLDIKAEVKGSLPEVAASILSWESVSGNINGSVIIRGDLSDPEVNGRIQLSEGFGAFKVGDGVVGIEDVNSTILFDKSDLTIPSFSGNFGDGELKISGRINSYFDELERKGNLFISGENLLFEPTAGLAVRLDTDLNLLVFPGASPLLQGELVLTEAVYQKEITIQNIVAAFSRFIVGKNSISRLSYENNSDQSDGLNLAVRARTSQGLLVDTSVFKAELDGDLRLSGKLNNPIINGAVDIVDGSFVINQTKFEVLGGSMKFDGRHSIEPLISLSSEGDLRKRTGDTEKIFLNISGPLGSTKVSFSSDGATPPKDIVRQLGVGSGGSQLYLVQSDAKNIGFREVISPSSDLSLSERFAGLTGFDQVRIETAVSTRTGEFVPQILGSRPLPYDFRSTLWTELSGDRASGARLEYRLRDDVSPFVGWRSQSVTQASTTNSSNFSVGIRLKETFKGISFIDSRIKESD